ncbi:S-protein homolog 1 [Linum perenne]
MSSKLIVTGAMVVAAILLATIPPSTAGLMPTIHMHIVNKMSAGELMLVHCKCTDHDIGYHYVKIGDEFEWKFNKHWNRRTHWRCYLAADKTRFMYLDVYDSDGAFFSSNGPVFDNGYNDNYWDIKEDGAYVRDKDSGADYFAQGWQTVGESS